MNNIIDENGENRFANGQSRRDLRVNLDFEEANTQLALEGLRERAGDSDDRLEALRKNPDAELDRRIELPPRDHGISSGDRWFRRIGKRAVAITLLVLALAAIAPFVWNYLQSYESTDDAQIDGHIDPLSSRIDGTVIAVHAEDDDRVKAGELLVEIDPRDYEVAEESARARLGLALAQVASAKQDYAAALANIREAAASNYKAQRDAQRYVALFNQGVVAQDQYDQYTAGARVDAAKVDSAREAAGSALKTIAARQADADAAKAALDQALLNLSYTRIYAPANGIVGKRAVQLGSRIQPGQTLMFVTETDNIWVTADFKETQLARMKRGERVTIHVDTFGRNYHGYIENMPGASGDRFSLLPAENATGNYVKVVQRLPVRILLQSGEDPDHLLHPGMSVEPTAWLR
ncbi:MAG: rane fusion protein multidrug efflux system [Candidatus Binataceae bacterium]|jgi:membrane fusion protein (multidrug efflux system)|nr:rane fusion protein multidrug efflux system [Candidatus Binataceae bacterium]